MIIIKVKDYDEMSKEAANIIISAVLENPNLNLGLATGGSPVGLYENMVLDHKKNHTSYKNVSTFNLDEYLGLERSHDQTYYTFMFENLFKHIDINKDNIHIPNGNPKDINLEVASYQKLLDENQIDLQLLGIGTNGHIGFNEPGSSFEGHVSVADLTEETIKANARYFEGNEDLVPTKAISMGIKDITNAKAILLIASGENKADAIYGLVEGEINEDMPASILQRHPNVTLVIDEAAASKLSK